MLIEPFARTSAFASNLFASQKKSYFLSLGRYQPAPGPSGSTRKVTITPVSGSTYKIGSITDPDGSSVSFCENAK